KTLAILRNTLRAPSFMKVLQTMRTLHYRAKSNTLSHAAHTLQCRAKEAIEVIARDSAHSAFGVRRAHFQINQGRYHVCLYRCQRGRAAGRGRGVFAKRAVDRGSRNT